MRQDRSERTVSFRSIGVRAPSDDIDPLRSIRLQLQRGRRMAVLLVTDSERNEDIQDTIRFAPEQEGGLHPSAQISYSRDCDSTGKGHCGRARSEGTDRYQGFRAEAIPQAPAYVQCTFMDSCLCQCGQYHEYVIRKHMGSGFSWSIRNHPEQALHSYRRIRIFGT